MRIAFADGSIGNPLTFLKLHFVRRGERMDDLYQVAEIELSYKNKPNLSKRPQITKSKDAYDILMQHWADNKINLVEEAKLLLLNRSNHVLGIYHLATGGVAGVIVDPKIVFMAALKANASSIILAHNHPSESTKPSQQDKVLTEKISDAGRLLDLFVLDHLIVSPNGYYSFSDEDLYVNNKATPYQSKWNF